MRGRSAKIVKRKRECARATAISVRQSRECPTVSTPKQAMHANRCGADDSLGDMCFRTQRMREVCIVRINWVPSVSEAQKPLPEPMRVFLLKLMR